MYTNTGDWQFFGPENDDYLRAIAEYPPDPTNDFPGGCDICWRNGAWGQGWYARHKSYSD